MTINLGSDAILKVYYFGTEVYGSIPMPLVKFDMWEVGTVNGATGEVVPSTGADVDQNHPRL